MRLVDFIYVALFASWHSYFPWERGGFFNILEFIDKL
jgi:hypothetical protein